MKLRFRTQSTPDWRSTELNQKINKNAVLYFIRGDMLNPLDKDVSKWKLQMAWRYRVGGPVTKAIKVLSQTINIDTIGLGLRANENPGDTRDWDISEEWIGLKAWGDVDLDLMEIENDYERVEHDNDLTTLILPHSGKVKFNKKVPFHYGLDGSARLEPY